MKTYPFAIDVVYTYILDMYFPFCPKGLKIQRSKISLFNGFITVDKVYTGILFIFTPQNFSCKIFGGARSCSYIYIKIKVMITYLTIYFAIGIILGFSAESFSQGASEWDNFIRIFVIILWPISLIYIIKEYLK